MENKILLVDDDPLQLKLVQTILIKGGYIVETSPDGINALNYLKNESNLPDIIITDIFMPKLNGFELCSRVVKIYPNIPVLLVTSLQDDNAVEKAFNAGADDYIKKPFTKTEILIRVANTIRKNIAENKLRDSEERFRDIATSIGDWIWETDIHGAYTYCSENVKKILGYTPKEMIGKTAFDFMEETNSEKVTDMLYQITEKKEHFETWNTAKNGRKIFLLTNGVKILDKNSKLVGYRGVDKDITEQKLAQIKIEEMNNELQKLAFTDTLTGFINRKPFIELLEKNIISHKRNSQKLALLFIDVDNFKSINDIYGHKIGDKALIAITEIIKNTVRKNDLTGRFGGDEFIVALFDIDSEEGVKRTAQKINDAFKEKVRIDNLLFDLGVSIGIAIYPQNGRNVADLLKNSDLAMYKAKKNVKNTFQIYKKKLTKEAVMEQSLLKALTNNEFSLHYQPIVNKDGKCFCIEALLRWTNSVFGNVPPNIFIPILEEKKAINKVGSWVFREACKQITLINKDKEYQHLSVSINLSELQIHSRGFYENFKNIVNETNAEFKNIVLEITEEGKMKNIEKTREILSALKNKDVGIFALDDFGSGYSSFSNLMKTPIDIVKIDKFIVDNLNSEKFAKACLNMISLIKDLGLSVIAEGVETAEQFEILSNAGCDYFQGFYFSEPIPNIYETLKSNNGTFL